MTAQSAITGSTAGARHHARTAPPVTARNIAQPLFFVVLLVLFVWAWRLIHMSILGFFDDLGNVWNLFKRMYPPDFSDLGRLVRLMIETLWIALLGTTLSVILSYPLAIGAAANTTPHRYVRFVCRSVITLSRAVPDLILAAIFVAAFGTGPFPGILALGLHSIGMIGRLFADAIEQAAEAPREAVSSVGSTRRQTIRAAIIPQALPSMIATALFRLEINIRGSSVLGLVGAGGIGVVISQSLELIQYKPALAAVVVIFVVVMAVELLSTAVRLSLLGENANMGRTRPRSWLSRAIQDRNSSLIKRSAEMRAVSPPWTSERVFRTSVGFFLGLLTIIAVFNVDTDWWSMFGQFPRLWDIIRSLFPPSFGGQGGAIVAGLKESFAISVLATLMGITVSLPLSLFVARNINARRIVATLMRVLVVALRGIPELVVAVIFVAAMGLGPIPGTLALSVTVAFFSTKLFADTLEEVNPAPREAVVSVGATRSQEFFAAVVPQFVPPFISHLFYLFDVYLRSSTVLGIVGGGGIGFLLLESIRGIRFDITMMIVLLIFLMVLVIEWIGLWVRGLFR